MRSNWWIWGAVLLVVLAACGGDGDKDKNTEPTVSSGTSTTPGFTPGGGIGLNVGAPGSSSGLPGCSDPSDTECPAPLDLDLDAQVSNGGIQLSYPSRYFVAQTSDENTDGVPIELVPSERFNWSSQAVFQAYFTSSIDQALSELQDPITGEWSGTVLSGTIGVVKDQSQDPPVNTTVGAFPLEDGRVFVLRLQTTGKYGWDLFSEVYAAIANSIQFVEPVLGETASPPEATAEP